MKVKYYFRNSGPGNYSIENVFNVIISSLGKSISVDMVRTRGPLDLLAVFNISRLSADIHHITGAVNYLALFLPGHNTIVTVHDVGHYTQTLSGWRKLVYRYLFWSWPLRKSRNITAISGFTRNQLVVNFGVDPERITVIPNPVNSMFVDQPLAGNPLPVILQIGAGKNKNIEGLIEAVRGLEVKLLLIRPAEPQLIKTLNESGIQFEFRSNLSDAQLIKAYADCDLLYFASTYEGFGLPMIEAMATGRPVITSALEPMIEVAGDAALFVNPLQPGEIRNAIYRLINSAELRNEMVKKGHQRVGKFEAGKIASMYFELYNKIIDGSA